MLVLWCDELVVFVDFVIVLFDCMFVYVMFIDVVIDLMDDIVFVNVVVEVW